MFPQAVENVGKGGACVSLSAVVKKRRSQILRRSLGLRFIASQQTLIHSQNTEPADIMEHIDPIEHKRYELRSSRPCEFCKELDPQFPHRHPLDQVVSVSRKTSAASHLTEDGYVRHRMVELSRLASRYPRSA